MGCRGALVYGVFAACGEFMELVEWGMQKKEGTQTWNNTCQIEFAHAPILLCGIHMGQGGPCLGKVGGKAVLFELKRRGVL